MAETIPNVYDLARGVLQRTLDRLNAESERHANTAQRATSEHTRHRLEGHSSGFGGAAEILEDEIRKLPYSTIPPTLPASPTTPSTDTPS